MKILVTGSEGFVGSAFVRRCGDFELVCPKTDVLHKSIERSFRGVDTVVHLAAVGGMDSPWRIMQVNNEGTVNLLEAAKRNNVRNFIFASTSLVYGNPIYSPMDEDHPVRPQGTYEISKAIAEKNCMLYGNHFNVVCLRFSNIYGVGGKGAINVFIRNLLDGRKSEICGGNQLRDFIHVEDAVDAIILSLERGCGVFNISSGESHSINEAYSICEDAVGRRIEPEYMTGEMIGYEANELVDYEISNKLARWNLLFKPKVGLKEGIKRTVEGTKLAG